MTQHTFRDLLDWAIAKGEGADTIRAIQYVPARLGMLDHDIVTLPADMHFFETTVAGHGYALISRAQNMKQNGRRADSRIRAALRRFLQALAVLPAPTPAHRQRYSQLMALIEAEEGVPGSGALWNTGRHRSLVILRARARCAPEELSQSEIDRIGQEVSAKDRKSLRKSVAFLNSLTKDVETLPAIQAYLPATELRLPPGSARARRIDWDALPEEFKISFETLADACLADSENRADAMLARIEAGEDPEKVAAEADLLAQQGGRDSGKPTAARTGYREAVAWLVRAWEDSGRDAADLQDVRELFELQTIRAAITQQLERSDSGYDLKAGLESTTLKTRLTRLITLARRGFRDVGSAAVITLLKTKHYDAPRAKRKASKSSAVMMEVDRIAGTLQQRPELASVWANAPTRIAGSAERALGDTTRMKKQSREITALRLLAGAVAYAIQMSRPLRTRCLRHTRIASKGEAHANLLRSSPSQTMLTFRFAPWETKNDAWINVDVVGSDAEIVRAWLETWRPRLIELQGLDPDNIYLFPGNALPPQDEGDPIALPRGSYSTSAFLDLWRDASNVLGWHETPHRMRHVVALLSLAIRPGDHAFTSSVLGILESTARKYYGRDDGQAAAREARAAILAEHPDIFKTLTRRLHDAR
ncbi:hypothetical protein [Thioclava sp. F28-4]|uniref:hypothetical protein n=1 Tax=Thioclava sp. F28-4 TaxID=1915315 RepID=UPI000997936F|nr:hypothetical protein [Thioclava sp. F28-4]OOY02790.1 hypothetical protein BMI87_21090 [Thioclava sp. F28-4]